MPDPKNLEEAVAALVAVTDERSLRKAAAGEFGNEVRLLSIGELIRRDQRKRPARKAS